MSVGNRVFTKRTLPDPEVVKAFSKIAAANVADCMGRLCGMNPQIKLMSNPSGRIMCGVALTVKARAGDNMMLHKAMNISQPGDVIVISNEEERSRAVMGEIMFNYLQGFKKIEGIVIDGPVRDIDVLSKGTLPLYATGTTPSGPYKEGPGEVNVPVSCGGIIVNPGDIILGDRDGVIVIPKSDAHSILEKAIVLSEKDKNKAANSAAGTVNRQWVDDLLEKKDVEIIEKPYE
ncbi:RraA family protein [Pantoea ananatis]|jgi:regulator of RNase E activity RraA|uniref:RraA family protein n=1 Tax=Pantoea ananas TaxID=553 RepID=UPI00030FEB60|nr:RraA family protein [Pantoea ananatis]MDC7864652.1 methyltransferase [Pantoea ananatis]MDQ1227005.1 regulator of RNase E activity RraA [Pantoea ananatis]MDR6092304.1 regulator of RNase E activity RraA [Pantoea ananatis]NQE77373.1 methyltransferase [Pantoea ananatis]NQE81916.1 methyltransferase [Pantoea ananatis]